jgi:hypothetical protein
MAPIGCPVKTGPAPSESSPNLAVGLSLGRPDYPNQAVSGPGESSRETRRVIVYRNIPRGITPRFTRDAVRRVQVPAAPAGVLLTDAAGSESCWALRLPSRAPGWPGLVPARGGGPSLGGQVTTPW